MNLVSKILIGFFRCIAMSALNRVVCAFLSPFSIAHHPQFLATTCGGSVVSCAISCCGFGEPINGPTPDDGKNRSTGSGRQYECASFIVRTQNHHAWRQAFV
jgi:hypothetical protein